jgi:hypothetical protein
MKPQDFNEDDWRFEAQSDYAGARNIHTHELIHADEYYNQLKLKQSYDKWQDIILEYSLDPTNEDLFDFLLKNYHSPTKINQ